MKTGLYYLDKMSKADQVRFLRNFSNPELKYGDHLPRTIYELLSRRYDGIWYFVSAGFVWQRSVEGHLYWSDIAHIKS